MKVLTEEEFLASRGAGMAALGEFGLHRQPRRPSKAEQRRQERFLSEKLAKWQARRDELRKEYRRKVRQKQIQPPTRIQRLLKIAAGHPDNASVQAARRVLHKEGIRYDGNP